MEEVELERERVGKAETNEEVERGIIIYIRIIVSSTFILNIIKIML